MHIRLQLKKISPPTWVLRKKHVSKQVFILREMFFQTLVKLRKQAYHNLTKLLVLLISGWTIYFYILFFFYKNSSPWGKLRRVKMVYQEFTQQHFKPNSINLTDHPKYLQSSAKIIFDMLLSGSQKTLQPKYHLLTLVS